MIKYYTSIREMARDMRTIKRVTRPIATNFAEIKAALNDDTIAIRGRGVVNQAPPKKISQKTAQEVNKKTQDLDKLMAHQLEVRNILNILQNEFKGDDYPELEKMTTIANRLIDNIGQKIQALKAAITQDAVKTLPQILGQVSNILKAKLDKELKPISSRAKTAALTAEVQGNLQHTIYYSYENVQDDAGEITPQLVFGLSHVNGILYINPSLHDIVVPGKFQLGFPLQSKSNSPTEFAKAALKEINNQLAADSILSAVTGNPVPFNKAKLDKLKPDNVKLTFEPKDDTLSVIIQQKMTDGAVQDLANNLTTKLNSLLLGDKTLPKMSIRYVKKKTDTGWELTYKFIPAKNYTGKTLDQMDVDHLRKRFNDEDIRKMLLSLQK